MKTLRLVQKVTDPMSPLFITACLFLLSMFFVKIWKKFSLFITILFKKMWQKVKYGLLSLALFISILMLVFSALLANTYYVDGHIGKLVLSIAVVILSLVLVTIIPPLLSTKR